MTPTMIKLPSYKAKIDSDSILLIKRILEIIDLFNLNKNENFIFNSELFKSFEILDFPNWSQYYPIHKGKNDSPFSSISEIEMKEELSLNLENEERFIKESHLTNEIRKLGNKNQLNNKEPYLNEKQANLILSCYAWMNFSFCAALFGKSPFALFESAQNGDQDAILKLIQLDKSLVDSDWSMREIKKAQLSGDQKYFKKLSLALTRNPFKPKKRNLKLSIVLVFGWEMELGKLSNDEILEFVKDLKIYEGDDPDSLYREIKRLGLRRDKAK